MSPVTQNDDELDSLVRKRIRALRVAQGWSLEELAGRAHIGQSTLSRIENGQRRLALRVHHPSRGPAGGRLGGKGKRQERGREGGRREAKGGEGAAGWMWRGRFG